MLCCVFFCLLLLVVSVCGVCGWLFVGLVFWFCLRLGLGVVVVVDAVLTTCGVVLFFV